MKLDLDAIRAFASQLAPGARILLAGCGEGHELAYFKHLGFKSEGFDPSAENVETARKNSGCEVWRADPMLLSLARESYDGIWAHGLMTSLSLPGCQRVMGSFFAALKPRGILFVSIEEGEAYSHDDFASLIRQSGFTLLMQGSDSKDQKRIGFIARRV